MPRAPEPTKLKLLKGVAKNRINNSEPIPSDRDISCPSWVPARGRELWDDVAPDLIAKGVLTQWDVSIFGALCEQFALYREAIEQVHRDGVTVEGYRGITVKHPGLQVQRDALHNINTLSAKFGLTPSDRSRLSVHRDVEVPGSDLLTGGSA